MEKDPYTVIYDSQCEICQIGVSWIQVLDRNHLVSCVPLDDPIVSKLHPDLNLDNCLKELHVISPHGKIYLGWDAIAVLASLFPPTFIIGLLGSFLLFRDTGRWLYAIVARNRYALSKCRGGVCRVVSDSDTHTRASLSVFWSCYTIGMLLQLPLVLLMTAHESWIRITTYVRTYRKRYDLLDGKLSLCFLSGFPCDLISIFFGEQFLMILYHGVAIDPGSVRMRHALERHIDKLPVGRVKNIVATHHHEEHVGNLNWLSAKTSAPIFISEATSQMLQPPALLPFIRRLMIGQPPSLTPSFRHLQNILETTEVTLEIYPAPGHASDCIVL